MSYKERKEKIEKKYKDIISDLKKGRCTKQELSVKYNLDERSIRRIIQEISYYFPVISFSSTKGYYIPTLDENTNTKEILEDLQHTINEHQSRIGELKRKMKPLIAMIKEMEKKNENCTRTD